MSGGGESPPGGFEPVALLELELEERLLVAVGSEPDPRSYRFARVLVRLHGTPLGTVDFESDHRELTSDEVAERAERELVQAIDDHLRRDGLDRLSPGRDPASPRCVEERLAFAARAPLASVVIGTRDRPDRLAATLDTVLALEYPRFEVIVVDNAAATDATRDLVRRRYAHAANVRYVREPVPGLAMAHNRGLDAARGEIVAFTDDDVAVDPHWLVELARSFELADDVACVTGLILPTELETPAQLWLETWVRHNKGYTPRLFDLGANRPADRLFPYTAGTFGSGANMAFRADALRAIGGFDPATGTGSRSRGGDDLAGFFSILAEGHTLVYQPGAILRHAYRREAESLRALMFDYGAGLGAFLTKVVVDSPGRLPGIVWRIPFGAAHALRLRPSVRDRGARGPARGLAARERLGMLAGPFGYLIERQRRRALYANGRRAAPSPRGGGPDGYRRG